MDILWAPWRMSFIQRSQKKKPSGCIFCRACHGTNDKANLVVDRSTLSFAVLNVFPYNNGHLMIAPVEHSGDFGRITPTQWQDMMAMVLRCQRALEKAMHPHGYNIGINLGRAGGAGIEDHLHIHLVPRWNGDSNFMPVVAATKVLPQSLAESFERLARALKKIRGRRTRSGQMSETKAR